MSSSISATDGAGSKGVPPVAGDGSNSSHQLACRKPEPRPIGNGEVDNGANQKAIKDDKAAFQLLSKNYNHSDNKDKEDKENVHDGASGPSGPNKRQRHNTNHKYPTMLDGKEGSGDQQDGSEEDDGSEEFPLLDDDDRRDDDGQVDYNQVDSKEDTKPTAKDGELTGEEGKEVNENKEFPPLDDNDRQVDDGQVDGELTEEERKDKIQQLKKELSGVTVAVKKAVKRGETNEELSDQKSKLEDQIYDLFDINEKLAWTKHGITNILAQLRSIEPQTNPLLEEKLKVLQDREDRLRKDGSIGKAVSSVDSSVLLPAKPITNNPPDGQGFVLLAASNLKMYHTKGDHCCNTDRLPFEERP